jgi:hypothetical protein
MIIENTLIWLRLPLTLGILISGLHAIRVRRIRNSKESNAAHQSIRDRREMLKSLAFADLTNPNYVRSLLLTPANRSDFCKQATEVVRISAHPVPNGVTQLTRTADGLVKIDSVAARLGDALIKIQILASSKLAGGRARSAQTSIVISNRKAFMPIFSGLSQVPQG